jgi:two-component system, NtrC family, sensor kinase
MRRRAKLAKAKVEAKLPVTRKSLNSDGAQLRDLEKRLAEALKLKTEALQREAEALKRVAEAREQQAATAEILRVISSSPTDSQPVFDTIARSAMDLCNAAVGVVTRYDGDLIHLAAHSHVEAIVLHDPFRTAEGADVIRHMFPMRPARTGIHGRIILEGGVVHIPDAQADEEYSQSLSQALHLRSAVGVPMVRDGRVIGAVAVGRVEVRPFTDKEIALLQTFAAQAVIAIENVRLFNETKEALEQQTATSEILSVISSSPTDVQPVFDAVAESAARLCESYDSQIWRRDGDRLLPAAHHGPIPVMPTDEFTLPLVPGTVSGRSVLEGRTVLVADVQLEAAEFPQSSELSRRIGFRTILSVPLMREGVALGAIILRRTEAQPFSERQIALLQTFADQAVIAIENVRLFKELQEKNGALTEAHARVTESLEQQTATAEVLRVISGSPTDLQPVFDSMLQSAVRLLGGFGGAILLYDGRALHLGAVMGGRPQSGAEDWFRSIYPIPLDPDTPVGSAILERRMIQLPDTEESASQITREVARGFQFRALVTVPMLREGSAIGTISITRAAPGEFSDRQVEVLQTFADQAVIAIENVRLFKELEASNREIAEKSRQLEVASQHKSEFLANMSHELRTPLNAILGFSEVLSERMFGELNEKQEEYLKDIYTSGTHLLSLINDILDLSKIEAGRMELELTDFHLPTALDSALTLVRERAGRRGIALHMNVDSRLGQIKADERKVRQVVLNLLSNAIKFTPEGGRIEVQAAPKDGVVEVSVSDTGVGIAPEDQEMVFEEFRQVGTAAKKVEGTGLGLTLCRKFVELHGGRIWVKSQVGEGSTFEFMIPVRHGE